MKTMIPPVVAFCLAITLFSCAAEDIEMQAEELNAANLEVYQTQDLEGIWELESMHSNVAIDLNGDKTSNTDILTETICFDDMSYEFKGDGTVRTSQAQLYFDTSGRMTCKDKKYDAPYSLKEDMLTINIPYNGKLEPLTKQIILSNNKNQLEINLTRIEASAYIKDDRGTSTEKIGEVKMVYIKRVITPSS